MSKCQCDEPYTYRQSLAQQAGDHGGLIAVAPMMGMDECIRCFSAELGGRVNQNLDINLLTKALKELKESS